MSRLAVVNTALEWEKVFKFYYGDILLVLLSISENADQKSEKDSNGTFSKNNRTENS
mgnify:CR=1 FL=1